MAKVASTPVGAWIFLGFVLVCTWVVMFVLYGASSGTRTTQVITNNRIVDLNGTDIYSNLPNMSSAEVWTDKFCMPSAIPHCVYYDGTCIEYQGCFTVGDLNVLGDINIAGAGSVVYQEILIGGARLAWVVDHVYMNGSIQFNKILLPITFDSDSFATITRSAGDTLNINAPRLTLGQEIWTTGGTKFKTQIYVDDRAIFGNTSLIRFNPSTQTLQIYGGGNGISLIDDTEIFGLFYPRGKIIGPIILTTNSTPGTSVIQFEDATDNRIESINGPLTICANSDLTFCSNGTGNIIFTAPITMGSSSPIGGNVHMLGTLTIDGMLFAGGLTLTAGLTVPNITVLGPGTFSGKLTVNNDLEVTGVFSVGGLNITNGLVTNTLYVSGASEFDDVASFNLGLYADNGVAIHGSLFVQSNSTNITESWLIFDVPTASCRSTTFHPNNSNCFPACPDWYVDRCSGDYINFYDLRVYNNFHTKPNSTGEVKFGQPWFYTGLPLIGYYTTINQFLLNALTVVDIQAYSTQTASDLYGNICIGLYDLETSISPYDASTLVDRCSIFIHQSQVNRATSVHINNLAFTALSASIFTVQNQLYIGTAPTYVLDINTTIGTIRVPMTFTENVTITKELYLTNTSHMIIDAQPTQYGTDTLILDGRGGYTMNSTTNDSRIMTGDVVIDGKLIVKGGIIGDILGSFTGTPPIYENPSYTWDFAMPSDIRTKKVLEHTNKSVAFEEIRRIDVVNFVYTVDEFKNKYPGVRTGFVANDLEEIIPRAVFTKDYIHYDINPESGKVSETVVMEKLKTVNYEELIPELVAAIQHLANRIEELEKLLAYKSV
jgi:hypothetical protein